MLRWKKRQDASQKRQVRLLNIREIARQAGLSIATISRVINHPETVAPETRERVLGILESCNYSPKLAAKPPRKKTGAVVLIVPVLPRYYGILAGIRQVLQANGYQLTICETSGFPGRGERKHPRGRGLPAGRRDPGARLRSPAGARAA